MPAHVLFRANPKLFSVEQTALLKRYQANIQIALEKIAEKKRHTKQRPIENHVHSRLPAAACRVVPVCAPIIASSSIPVSPHIDKQEEQAGQLQVTPPDFRSASVASYSTTIRELDPDFEQIESDLHQDFEEQCSNMTLDDEADWTGLLLNMELLDNRAQKLLGLLEDCSENAALLSDLNSRAQQNFSKIDQADSKQLSVIKKIQSVRKEKKEKQDDLYLIEAELEKTKKEIAAKEAEEDELLHEQWETCEHSRNLKGDLGFCLDSQMDQIQIMSLDVQAACNESKGVAAAGKAASSLLKRIYEDREQKEMRDEITEIAITFLAKTFLNLGEAEIRKIDIVWISNTFGICKHGTSVLATFGAYFSDLKVTEAKATKLSRKLFEAPEAELEKHSVEDKTEDELQVIFAAKMLQAKVKKKFKSKF